MRSKCFDLLMFISTEQLAIAKYIRGAKNVTDWSLYLQKQNTRLSALGNARMTLESIIKNIDSHTDLKNKIAQIEAAVKAQEGGE